MQTTPSAGCTVTIPDWLAQMSRIWLMDGFHPALVVRLTCRSSDSRQRVRKTTGGFRPIDLMYSTSSAPTSLIGGEIEHTQPKYQASRQSLQGNLRPRLSMAPQP